MTSPNVIQAKVADRVRAASVDPASFNDEDMTFDVVWTAGARVRTVANVPGQGWIEFDEVLRATTASWDLSRVRSGVCTVLDAHGRGEFVGNMPGTDDVLGVVLEVTFSGGEGRARCRFSPDPDKLGKWLELKAGVLRGISPRYRVERYREITTDDDEVPVFEAVRCELRELSILPIPADAGARVRVDGGGRSSEAFDMVELELDDPTNMARKTTTKRAARNDRARAGAEPNTPTETSSAADEASTTEETTEDDGAGSDPNAAAATGTTGTSGAAPAAAAAAGGQSAAPQDGGTPAPDSGSGDDARRSARPDESRIRADERDRCDNIRAAADTLGVARLDPEYVGRLISNGVPVERARTDLAFRRAELDAQTVGTGVNRTHVVEEEFDKVRGGIENALMVRVGALGRDKLTDQGRAFDSMRTLRMVEQYYASQGNRLNQMGDPDIAALGLGMLSHGERARAGLHTTSDFSLLLENVANKRLQQSYEAAPHSWDRISRRTSASDFKLMSRPRLGLGSGLAEVGEHGEFSRGTISEGTERYQLKTYGKIFGFTRQAMINDDLNGLSNIGRIGAVQARELEADVVWGLVGGNVSMNDGSPLFDAAHNNVTAGAISVAALGAARAALRLQTDPDGTVLNLQPAFLFVPAAIETTAQQFTAQITPDSGGNVNPFQSTFTEVIAEPRLDAYSALQWYIFASPDRSELLEHAYLNGADGPSIDTRVGFEIDGMEFKVRLDFGAGVMDWRGGVRSSGA